MKYVGAHVSAAGGVDHAVIRAHELKATAFALFTALLNNSESCCFAKPVLVENACHLRFTVFL
ncbi:hypothetical protein [Symbiopectobacterium sp. RP]|uniref:hypothetical protein n=1 Tax=Symbiopectobacterium sp. RP TaxID=3248553 RepID=UPI003D2D38DC